MSESSRSNAGNPRDPFFIVGCVRSGTTMLRDVLRRHPRLEAPEESHFFRVGEPFATLAYSGYFTRNLVLKKHREMDGISEIEFAEMLTGCKSRAELCERYMSLFMQRRKPSAERWFDKTPQNVYGAALIAASFPNAKFVHIVRDPLDVVSSLRIGKVIKVENLVGACNYWIESIKIMQTLRDACAERIHEFRYEDFIANPIPELGKLLAFLGEKFEPQWFETVRIQGKAHDARALFSQGELELIDDICGDEARRFGYLSPNEAACVVPPTSLSSA